MHKQAMEMAKQAMCDAHAKGYDCMTSQDWDDLKDCVEAAEKAIKADYYYMMVCAMKEEEEYEKHEEKWMLKELKEEHGMSEDESRRFYDAWRYKSGRFAPKGRGTRRGYDEPPYYHMMPEDYKAHDPEYWRDVDRKEGRMYFTPMSDGRTMVHDGTGGDVRGYSDGYADGMRDGRNSQSRDRREGRSGQMRRGYMETKEAHKDNTPQDKQEKMKSLEAYAKELTEDVIDMVADATPEERNLLRQKMQMMIQKIPQ